MNVDINVKSIKARLRKGKGVTMVKARIVEIFSSLQGEGIRLGKRQIFIRFAGCNLDCSYCDTPASRSSHAFQEMNIDDVLERIKNINKEKENKTISITGGEPLLQAAFLKELFPRLKTMGFGIYLDTNGTKPSELRDVYSWCDCIAMDIKLASDCKENFFAVHKEFLNIAADKIFVKIVLTSSTREEEVIRVIGLINNAGQNIPLVLQPVTVIPGITSARPDTVLAWWKMAKKHLPDARLIPQKHVEWNIK